MGPILRTLNRLRDGWWVLVLGTYHPQSSLGWWCRKLVDGSVEEVKKSGLECDVGKILQFSGSVPSLSPACCHPRVKSRTPTLRSTGPRWHVPALLSGAGLTVYPALWL